MGVPGGGGRGGVGHNARVSSGSQKQMTNQSNKVHGNSHSSTNMQHGYEIYEVNSGNVVKTGISGQKLNANGTSPRANTQMKNLNSKGTTQYAARVVVKNVPGRVRILRWEGLNTRRLAEQGNNLYKQERPEWKVYSEIYN